MNLSCSSRSASAHRRTPLVLLPSHPTLSLTLNRHLSNASKRVKNGYWKNIENRRKQLDSIGVVLGVKRWLDWRNVSPPPPTQDLSSPSTSSLWSQYATLYKLLSETFHEFHWHPWSFGPSPRGWFLVTSSPPPSHSSLPSLPSRDLQKHHKLQKLIISHVNSDPNEFDHLPLKVTLLDRPLAAQSIDQFLAGREIKRFSDIFKLKWKDFHENCGQLLKVYAESHYLLLKGTYPQYSFSPWRFVSLPNNLDQVLARP